MFRQAIHNIHEGYFTVYAEYPLISGFQIVTGLSSVPVFSCFVAIQISCFCTAENGHLFSFRSPNGTVAGAHTYQNLY